MIYHRWTLAPMVAAIALGCGSSSADLDANGHLPSDGGADAIDAYHAYYDASGDSLPLLTVTDTATGMQVPADYDCVGSYQDPPGSATEFTIAVNLIDSYSGAPVSNNALVAIYRENIYGYYDNAYTDSNGHIPSLRVPPQSYRVWFAIGAANQIHTSYRNFPLPPGTTQVTLKSVSQPTLDAIGGALGMPWMGGNGGAVQVTVRDCQGRSVAGAAGLMAVGLSQPSDYHSFYYGGQNLPAPRSTLWYTGLDGLFIEWNVQGGTDVTFDARGFTIHQPQEIAVSHYVLNSTDFFTFLELPPHGP